MVFIPALIFFILILVASAVKICREYERGVVFRLGRLIFPPKGPGIFLIIPIVDRMVKISLRTVVMDFPSQDVITRGNVSIKVNAVVYFRVMQADKSIVEVENYLYATSQLAQTTLRSVVGQAELGRVALRPGKDEQGTPEHLGQADGPLGHQGFHGGDQTRRFS
jgi:regulator of protease activity HflC (stomatin/prohibitin superfamily)